MNGQLIRLGVLCPYLIGNHLAISDTKKNCPMTQKKHPQRLSEAENGRHRPLDARGTRSGIL